MKYVFLLFHFGPAKGSGVGILHSLISTPEKGDIITPTWVGPDEYKVK